MGISNKWFWRVLPLLAENKEGVTVFLLAPGTLGPCLMLTMTRPPGPVHGAPLGVVRGRPVYRNTDAHQYQTPFMAGVGLADFCKNSVFLKPISAASDNFLYYYEQSFDYKCMTESKRMIICLYVHFVN